MTRWRRDGIAATIAVTILLAMVLGYTLHQLVDSGLLYAGMPARQDQEERYVARLPATIASLIDLMDRLPKDERPAVIAGAERAQLHINLLETPRLLASKNTPESWDFQRRVKLALTTPRDLVVGERNPSKGADGQTLVGYFIQAPLGDGQWLLFRTTSSAPPPVDPEAINFSRVSFVAWLSLAGLFAIVLTLFAARRVSNPLSQLARAVEQLGGTGDAPALPPRGPHELRVTIDAFNRMQERLRRYHGDRAQMLAAMSHDLRTPITRLKLRLEFVEDNEQRRKMLGELDGMSAMIESTLAFARDDTKLEDRMLVDVTALVEGICEDASDIGQNVTFSGPREVSVSCRPMAMRRAISNLVDNAVKYGHSATVTLIEERNLAVIQIDDEGPGIPSGDREKVFEAFYRMESSRNAETGGVGLGLAVARSVAREHSGDVTLENREGGGLCVRLELPAQPLQ